MKAYLAGAIEHAPDKGKRWRDELSQFLKERFCHESYNPHIEEPKILTPEEREKFRSLKITNLPEFQNIVRKLIRNDIHSILTEIDYMICLWDDYAEKGGGTYGELTFAFYHGIPIYMVVGKPIEEISGWILACATQFFDNFDKLKAFLISKY